MVDPTVFVGIPHVFFYDILHREELYVSTAADKRTCLEALTTRDKLKEIGGET